MRKATMSFSFTGDGFRPYDVAWTAAVGRFAFRTAARCNMITVGVTLLIFFFITCFSPPPCSSLPPH